MLRSFAIPGHSSMKRREFTCFLLKRLSEAQYLLYDRRDVCLCFFAYEIVKLLFRHHGITSRWLF